MSNSNNPNQNPVESFVSKLLNNVEIVGKAIEVDFIDGTEILYTAIKNISEDITIAGTIITISVPALSGAGVAIAELSGSLDSVFTILDSLSTLLVNPNALSSDYQAVKTTIQKAISIYNAQKDDITLALTDIEKAALSFKGITQGVDYNPQGIGVIKS